MAPSNRSNNPEDLGKITLEPAQPFATGIINDVKRTVGTHWLKEMTNFNQRTIAVTFLLFISVIAPTLTFGGTLVWDGRQLTASAVYGKVTDNRMGVTETILATSITGIGYSLVGGMPIVSDTPKFLTSNLCPVYHRLHWASFGLHYSNLRAHGEYGRSFSFV